MGNTIPNTANLHVFSHCLENHLFYLPEIQNRSKIVAFFTCSRFPFPMCFFELTFIQFLNFGSVVCLSTLGLIVEKGWGQVMTSGMVTLVHSTEVKALNT